MVRSAQKVRWDRIATKNFESAIEYIRRDSVKNANKVKSAILLLLEDIGLHPEKYPLDKYKYNNDGTYRAFEKHHYRIVYRILQTEIKIITIRHTKMEPQEY